jgi:hypothetical protein
MALFLGRVHLEMALLLLVSCSTEQAIELMKFSRQSKETSNRSWSRGDNLVGCAGSLSECTI